MDLTPGFHQKQTSPHQEQCEQTNFSPLNINAWDPSNSPVTTRCSDVIVHLRRGDGLLIPILRRRFRQPVTPLHADGHLGEGVIFQVSFCDLRKLKVVPQIAPKFHLEYYGFLEGTCHWIVVKRIFIVLQDHSVLAHNITLLKHSNLLTWSLIRPPKPKQQ